LAQFFVATHVHGRFDTEIRLKRTFVYVA
jgi:hypothetical protein